MKTLEDFKGTREPMECKGLSAYTIKGDRITLMIPDPEIETAEANTKLFANSYKLLEAADKAHNLLAYIERHCPETWMEATVGTGIATPNFLQQAIQDCL